MPLRLFRAALTALACLAFASGSVAQTAPAPPPTAAPQAAAAPRYTAQRAAAPAVIDGVLDDAAWAGPPTFEIAFETRPAENEPSKVKTDVWIAFDDRNIYFAFRCLDPHPDEIRARFTDRDRAFQDDFVGVVLDTFDDQRRAFEFFVNPLGVQMDLIQDDVTGNEDESWDTIWSSAGKLTAEGYVVEAAVPLSSLRYPAGAKATGSWAIDAVRMVPRNVRTRNGLVPLLRGHNCYLCQSAKLDGIVGLQPQRDIELDPTVISVRSESRQPFPDGPFETDADDTEAGLTARWGITPDMTLLGTVNPDFSQIEADAAQLDVNNQFALFYPEKRPFFLEGADLFDTGIDAVYTRNIADPAWGAKLTGKLKSNVMGLVVAKDRTTNLLLPSAIGSQLASVDEESIAMIGRYRRDLGKTNTLGGLYTDREGDDYFNRVAGGDGQFRLKNRHTISATAMFSETQYSDPFATQWAQPQGTLSGHAISATYEYSVPTWRGYANYDDFADNFRADLGFVPRVGYRRGEIGAQRIWEGNGKHWYTRMEAGGNYDETVDPHGQLIEREIEGFWFASGPLQSTFNFGAGGGKEVYRGLEVHDRFLYAYVEASPTRWFHFYNEVIGKKGFDYANVRPGDELSINGGVRFDVGRHLRLTVDDSYQSVDVEEGELFSANVVELRATWQFNLRMFVRVISQYLEIERDPALYTFEIGDSNESLFNQLLFSYKLNPQTVLFLGYSDNGTGDETIDLTRQNRTLFLKLGYAWRL